MTDEGVGMRKLRWGGLMAVAAVGVVATLASVSWATHTYAGGGEVVVVSDGPGGNASCPSTTIEGAKIDPGANYEDQYVKVTNYDGQSFSWSLVNVHGPYDMAVVIVKGGPNSAVYTYDYATTMLDDADSGLTAPTNPRNGKDYGISHIQFCYDPKGGGDN
jgi:hypothetical protein